MNRIALVLAFAVVAVAGFLGRGGEAPDAIAGVGNKAIIDLAGCSTNTFSANDDGTVDANPGTDEIDPVGLPFSINFFGQNRTTIFINNNGNVTFDAAQEEYTPFSLLSTSRVIIAPYFADVDTRGSGSGLTTYGATTFFGRPAFCVNWVDVGYYNSHVDKKNSFQLLLVERSDVGVGDFDMIFNYNKIQWETGDASGGSSGLGGSSARAGYSNGTDTALELPGSAANAAFLDSTPSGLIHSSRGTPQHGRYIFSVRSGAAPTGGFVSGRVLGDRGDGINEPLAGALVQICRQDVVPAVCSPTTTSANGEYNVAGLPAGTYNGVAGPPGSRPDLFPDVNDLFPLGNNQGRIDYDFKLLLPRPLPPGVTVQSIGATSGGSPVINWAGPVQITTMNADCAGGSGQFELIKDGEIIASGPMNATATPGLFKGTIPPLRPEHGPAVLHIEIFCPGAGVDKDIEVDVYIDPSGHVIDQNDNPVAGATVTLYRSDSGAGPFDVVPDGDAIMSPSNRTNPDMTDAEGFFHWDVIVGYYKVRAEKPGCVNPSNTAQAYVETAVLAIPPPALDLVLRLQCAGGPVPTNTPGGPVPTATPPGPTPTPPSGPTPTRTPTPVSGIVYGDVNCDGQINSIDAALVLQKIAGFSITLACNAAADVNQDGTLNSIDAAVILQYIAGLIDELPV